MNSSTINISFGMIVLNGEPFVRYNLRSLYPFAHQIIVVEGACPSAVNVARPDGHSVDGTIETLRSFKHNEDPQNKVIVVTAQDEGHTEGFWHEKNEMSKAYAKRATGNYLWQIDSDEFYDEQQIPQIITLLDAEHPDAVSFPMITFWGNIKYVTNSFYLVRDNAREYHRLFAWGPGHSYATHFPPTVLDPSGINARNKKWLRARFLEKKGIYLYHYSLLFPHQVYSKVSYYKEREKIDIDKWEEAVYRRLKKPFRAHNVYQSIGWLERYTGRHPSSIRQMITDIEAGRLDIQTRDCTDVENLLSNSRYVLACRFLSASAQFMSYTPVHFVYRICRALMNRVHRVFTTLIRR